MEDSPEYHAAAAPLATGGDQAQPVDAERAQALRDDVRRKYREANTRHLAAGNWFRLQEVLDQSDAQAEQLAALTTQLQQAEVANQELRTMNEALELIRAGHMAKEQQAIKLLMSFPEYEDARAMLESPKPAAAAHQEAGEKGGVARPWCARCPATEADVNTPGFRCQMCREEGIYSPEELEAGEDRRDDARQLEEEEGGPFGG